MNITFIGTGSAFNHEDGNNAALLEFNGTNLLLDCGNDVPQNFEKKYQSVGKINNIWISHMHADHIGGLEEIAYKNKFMNGGKKPNLICSEDVWKDLKGYLEMTLKWDNESGEPNLTIEDYFTPYILNNNHTYIHIAGEVFWSKKTKHIGNQPAYIMGGNTFIFTSDTKFINWTEYNLKDINYIFQDTQLQAFGNDVHTTLPDLLKLPEAIRNKIYCMHYGKNILEYKKQIENAKMHIVKQFETIEI